MWDWLIASVDQTRPHQISGVVAWHARIMVLCWGVIVPFCVLIARFGKVLPGQDWPRELDSQLWWRSHWMGQSAAVALALLGAALVLGEPRAGWHGVLGYTVIGLGVTQVLSGLFRGTKGGPTDVQMRGDHYDMTRWRLGFEYLHKTLGYGALALSVCAVLTGLWRANAPRWMWLVLLLWWGGLCCAWIVLQRRGRAIDTYQAIWGDDPRHPGNARPGAGWAMRRIKRGDIHVRND